MVVDAEPDEVMLARKSSRRSKLISAFMEAVQEAVEARALDPAAALSA